MPARGRKILALALVGGLFTAVAVAFWFQELRYLRPTPRPAHLAEVVCGTTVPLLELIPVLAAAGKNDRRPIFLHFFNTDCPCSRFNVDHLAELYREHGRNVRFVAIVQTTGEPAEAAALRTRVERTFAGMPVVLDDTGHLAEACGVYSTPQAAIFSSTGSLLYRGNYNASRYCEDPQTEFARIALEAVITGQPVPPMPAEATTAYGCELPAFTEHRSTPSPTL